MYEDEFELTFQVPEEESAPEPLAAPAAKPAAPVPDLLTIKNKFKKSSYSFFHFRILPEPFFRNLAMM